MGRHWKSFWNWCKNYANSQRKNPIINSLLSIFLLALSLFLIVIRETTVIFSITFLIILLLNIFNYKVILLGISLFTILFLSWNITFWILAGHQNLKIGGDFEIVKVYSHSFIIKYNSINVLIKMFKHHYKVGNIIYVSGKISMIEKITSFNKSVNVFLEIHKPFIKFISNNENTNYFHTRPFPSNIFLNLILFSKKIPESKEVNELLNQLNISHFFVISGFHFSILFFILNFMFKKIKFTKNISEAITLSLLFVYLMILKFQISAARSFFYIFLVIVNERFFNKKFQSHSILIFIAYIFLMFNPLLLFNYSFIFSFTITLCVLLVNDLISKKKIHFFWKSLIILFSIYASSFLISLTISKEISAFGFLYQLIFTPIFYISYFLGITMFWSGEVIRQYFVFLLEFLKLLNSFNVLIKITADLSDLVIVLHLVFVVTFELSKKIKRYQIYQRNPLQLASLCQVQ
ncbi:hypothetical protein NPL7_00810 [Metamycoplasma hyosynoviae]|uniref:MAG0480 family ComEC-like protein n=1 Tax=Metamycoplasma hyosynoviae TaxID=29559 RepID=UPI000461071F|nr:hypothetical protein NPL3_01890 [Metamycoplasma hyosynoviae]KDE42352.1 hypothetical protein NPL7_00810 [Metamycoplasma hyosynoviae]KDE43977.1 hypothetical protein NPL6_02650 [Metamycoplasma hyosynoviae]KDE44049.1 hypothetical protein NPL5_00375 [Metamycoplasma hyosynoviae]